MKTRTMVVSLVLSFTTAAFCFGASAPKTTPTPAGTMAKPAATSGKPPASNAARSPSPTMSAGNRLEMGTWKLNEGKSKFEPGMGRNTTVVYSPSGDMTKVTVDGTDKDGKATHSTWTGHFDGKVYPVKGDKTSDARVYRRVNDRTLDLTMTKGGQTVATGKIVMAKDGKSRVVTVNWTGADGKKLKSKAAYDKQ